MIKEVNSIASDVEDHILADGTLDTTTAENLLLELEGQLDALVELVDTTFRDDLFKELDTTSFKKDSTTVINDKVKGMKDEVKNDRDTVSENFRVPTDKAGLTIPAELDLQAAFTAGYTI